ncbi:adenine-specific methyltransferase EcoRI family protein [Ornithinimicrobium cryptoxanthini]|uniref:Adenine-specific methyltransferase EcoRI family protein n=1 Tax=Ornithinimicrobium cryptoxanthini TaxID=2934161 RepID=A0ABY4YMJ3_9MICO|nr:adenine-specific methyltransferase EcoRI family protein [Ornithinimicrobium cryptoxanthini]USQ77822.1 adenine-specific methyltransferase EcoRI family protein [Ornithinimicrobium cryptoxanthini]
MATARSKALSERAGDPKDEYYSRIEDIEYELRHYKPHFKDKVVFCNCDDPYESDFFKYFAMNFNALGLKKLIATSYTRSPIVGNQIDLFETAGLRDAPDPKQPYKVEITEVPDLNDDGAIDLLDVEQLLRHDANTMTMLEGTGDFRSSESVELLNESDIVVTNPPFSLLSEFIGQLMEHDKKFVIVASKLSVTYKPIWPFFQSGRMWLGNGFKNGNAYFRVPDAYRDRKFASGVFDPKTGLVKFRNISWFTNLDIAKRHENLTLFKRYTPEQYPTYVNYPAIEVGTVSQIPRDYDGEMGVSSTFLDSHNPDQFEIIGYSGGLAQPMKDIAPDGTYTKGGPRFYLAQSDGTYKRMFDRVIIKQIGGAS